MNKNLFIGFALLPLTTFSQITLDSADVIPAIGDTASYYTMKNPQDIGAIAAAGAGMVWDYSDMEKDDSLLMEFEAATTGGLQPDPDNTNLVEVLSGAFGERVQYKSSPNSLYIMGERAGLTQTNYNDDSLLKFQFPVKFNDTYTSSFSQTSGRIVQTVRTGTYKVTVDGSGRLVLPYGELPTVLRVKIEHNYRDSSRFTQADYSSTVYEYWQKNSVSYIMKIEFIDDDGSLDTIVSYRTPNESTHHDVGIEGLASRTSIEVFPNPTNRDLNVIVTNLDENINYNIVNILGEVEIRGALKEENRINVEALNAGIYFIRFDSEEIQPIRFIKK